MPAWVTSRRTAFYLTLSAIIVLFPNFFYMMYKIGGDMPIHGLRLTQALIAGVYVSGSIAYFTLRGETRIAYAFAIFEMFISFFYYWNRLMFDDAGNWHMNWYIIPACLIAMFLPWSVKNYASVVRKPSTVETEAPTLHKDNKSVIDNIVSEKAFDQLNQLVSMLKEGEKINDNISQGFNNRNYTRSPEDINIIDKLYTEKEELREQHENLKENYNILYDKVNLLEKEKNGDVVIIDSKLVKAEQEIQRLESEKEWYRSIIEEYNIGKGKEKVSPIFKDTTAEEKEMYTIDPTKEV